MRVFYVCLFLRSSWCCLAHELLELLIPASPQAASKDLSSPSHLSGVGNAEHCAALTWGESSLGGSSQGQCCPAMGCFVWLSVTATVAVTLLQGPQLCSEPLGDDCCEWSWRQGPEDFHRNVVMSLYKVACIESIAWDCAGQQPHISHFPVQTPLSLTTPCVKECKEAFPTASAHLFKPTPCKEHPKTSCFLF